MLLASLQKGTEYVSLIPKTLPQAYAQGGQISALRRDFEAKLDFGIIRLLKNLCDAYLTEWSGDIQIMVLDRIKTDYWYLSFNEIVLVLSDFSIKAYGKIRPVDIFERFEAYLIKRNEHSEYLAMQHKEAYEKGAREADKKESQRLSEAMDKELERKRIQKRANDLLNGES